MSDELHHECGVAALYWLDEPAGRAGDASRNIVKGNVTPLIPSMLLDLQNRGQLAAGLSSFDPDRVQLLDTYKDVGMVAEAFRMSRPKECQEILTKYAGRAAIGHTRYATCGQDDRRYAQPFERHHGRLWKWFSFAFNGNLANYAQLRDRLLEKRFYHFTLNTDTEMILHALSYRLRGEKVPNLVSVMRGLSRDFDGAYNIVFLDAMGRLVVARDPMGFHPLCWASEGKLFAAASESVALTNLGFRETHSLEPGEMAIVENGKLRFERFADAPCRSHCFFEWVYFANVASEFDSAGVYQARARSGRRLAEREDQPVDRDSIVVPVPDTAKAAADAFAYALHMPSVEGVIRNRYVGRTFIQPSGERKRSVKSKYTPLPSVLKGKRVFLVEDSIVRATTLAGLAEDIRTKAGAKEVHVRVACPPIVAPCFYGIDMSTLGELFAPGFVGPRYAGRPTEEQLAKMAATLKVNSLRYLNVSDLPSCLGLPDDSLCLGCVTGKYRTPWGTKLMRQAKRGGGSGRTYE
jgi:amidophosphoribosyltransferase